MLIRKALDLTYADVTPRSVYLDRRKFLRAMGIVGATAVAGKGLFELACLRRRFLPQPSSPASQRALQHHGKAKHV